jgi:hypothetical protein
MRQLRMNGSWFPHEGLLDGKAAGIEITHRFVRGRLLIPRRCPLFAPNDRLRRLPSPGRIMRAGQGSRQQGGRLPLAE